MKIATIQIEGKECSSIVTQNGLVLIETINQAVNKKWDPHLYDIFQPDWPTRFDTHPSSI